MAWLHTWAGLLVGWVLYFVFLTGTFGYVNAEVDRWMRPEQMRASSSLPVLELLTAAEQRLRARSGDAVSWQIALPGARGADDFWVGWRKRPVGEERFGQFTREMLDPQTGVPRTHKVRETGGGTTLYVMHYALHYIPYDWAIRIVGICTMFMLVAILTGVVAHKKIFREFFTFRPGKGQRSWLDGHNLLAVTALPFHLMITWSGLVFFLFIYMPVAIDVLYPEGVARDRFIAEAYGIEDVEREAQRPFATLVPLAPLLRQAEDHFGAIGVASVFVDNPGQDNARVTFHAQERGRINQTGNRLRFDGVTGALLDAGTQTSPGRFFGMLIGLHEGRFAGPILRFIYVISGLVGTAMIGTGLLLWSAKRKAKLRNTVRPQFGVAAVDVLNIGTIIGLPIGIAAYFWSNRLLPVEMPGRGAWEIHIMFIAWSGTFLYAIVFSRARAWTDLCWMAALAYALLPLLNALTTGRHPGVSISAKDWIFVGFDVSALVAGIFFGCVAYLIGRRDKAMGRACEEF